MRGQAFIIGASRTDFKRNLKKEGKTLGEVIVEVGRDALTNARVDPDEVQAGVVGNFAAGLFTRQLHLGAFLADVSPKLRGLPTLHVEAACASGGVAVLTAAQQIIGGIYDVVLVVGAEQQKTMSPAEGADVLGAAADYHREKSRFPEFLFPNLFGEIARGYAERYGLTQRQLANVVMKNHAHARLNPLAQMRDKSFTLDQVAAPSEANPYIAEPLKLTDCSQITDGAAALLLCSAQFFKRLNRAGSKAIRLAGFGHTTDYLALDRKAVPNFPIARKAISSAYDMARIGPRDLDAAEVHDCFSISEIIACELMGLAEPGQGAAFIASGVTALPAVRSLISSVAPTWSVPVNVGGGLIGDGHPVGATGVRQVAEAYAQLTQNAGARQVDGARRMLTFNMGGTFTTAVAMIWEGT